MLSGFNCQLSSAGLAADELGGRESDSRLNGSTSGEPAGWLAYWQERKFCTSSLTNSVMQIGPMMIWHQK